MAKSMTYGAHTRALLVLGLPLIGGNMAQVAIGMTDTAMLGWYSVEALAAVGLGSSLFFVFFIVGSGFAWAITPKVAAALAQPDPDTRIRRVTRMGIWLSVGFSVLSLPAFWWSSDLLRALGQDPEIADLAQDYLRIAGPGLVPALLVMLFKSYLAGMERTQVVLWVTLAAAIVNAVLNYALIFGHFGAPELGLQGAAIASLGVHVTSLIALVVYALRVFPSHDLFARIWRPDPGALREVARLGLPIGLTTLAEVGLFAGSQIMMGWISTQALAAHVIAIQLASLTFVVHMGLSQAATVRAGRAFGQGDAGHLARGARTATVLSVGFALLTMAVFWVMPEMLVGLFIGPDEADRAAIIAIGAALLIVAAVFQLADGAQVMALGLLRGLQDARVPMIHASVSYWIIGMPLCYVLGFALDFGGLGIWWGLVIGLSVAAVLLMHRFWRVLLPSLGNDMTTAVPGP